MLREGVQGDVQSRSTISKKDMRHSLYDEEAIREQLRMAKGADLAFNDEMSSCSSHRGKEEPMEFDVN